MQCTLKHNLTSEVSAKPCMIVGGMTCCLFIKHNDVRMANVNSKHYSHINLLTKTCGFESGIL